MKDEDCRRIARELFDKIWEVEDEAIRDELLELIPRLIGKLARTNYQGRVFLRDKDELLELIRITRIELGFAKG